MGRMLTWAALALAVAGVAWFLLFAGEEAGRDGGPTTLADLPEDGPPDDGVGPQLEGSGNRPHHEAAGGRTDALEGDVVGPETAPRAGVRVIVLEDPNAAWRIDGEVTTLAQYLEQTLARRMSGTRRSRRVVAEGTADAEGHYSIHLPAGRYRVQARPAAPWISTYQSVKIGGKRPPRDTTLTLFRGTPLRGRVLDTQDRPVAAKVLASAWWTDGPGGYSWADGPFATDPQTGAFSLAAVPDGKIRFTVELGEGRKLSGGSVDAPREEEVVLRVPVGGGSIRGTVTGSDGSPMPGAYVSITLTYKPREGETGGSLNASARADESGAYAVTDLPPGRVTSVQAIADGHLPYSKRPGSAGAPAMELPKDGTLTLDIAMSKGGTVRGRVTAVGSGEPVSGASVSLMRSARGGFRQALGFLKGVTDADGRYAIEYVEVGKYLALPECEGWYLPELDPSRSATPVYAGQTRTPPATLIVAMAAEGGEVERNLQLGQGFTGRGRVVDAKKRPVEGAEVRARGYGLQQVAWQWGISTSGESLATSATDGSFEIGGLPAYDQWVLYAKKEGLVGSYSEPFALGPSAQAPALELVMKEGAILRGRVEGATQEQLGKIQVGYWGDGSELANKSYGYKVSAEGTFEITGVPPGTYQLQAWVSGRSAPQVQVKDLRAGEVREGIVLELPQGCEVTGELVDSKGNPVPHQSLMVQTSNGGSWIQTQSDAKGRFTFQSVREGSVQVKTWGTDGTQVKIGKPFEAPAQDVRLVYDKPPSVTLQGRVVDDEGRPVPLSTVTASTKPGARRRPGGVQGRGTVDAVGGTFEVSVSGEGPWYVSAREPRAPDGTPLNLVPGRETVTDPTKAVVITLHGGHEIAGRVLDDTGKGMAGVRVTADQTRATTDRDGAFHLRGLPGGRRVVGVQPPAGWVRPAQRTVDADAKDVEFKLQRGVTIEGRVIGPDGEGLDRGYVSAAWKAENGAPPGSQSGQLRSGGTFRIQGVPPGIRASVMVQTWVQAGGKSYAPTTVENVVAGTTDLEIQLGVGLTVSGVVVDADGNPAHDVYVYGRSKDDNRMSGYVQVDAKGRFELGGLEARAYSLHVMPQGGGSSPDIQIEVTPPADGLRIELPRTTTVTGRVRGLSPEDATKWRVRFYTEKGALGRSTKLAPDGTFRAEGVTLEKGTYVSAYYWQDDRYGFKGPVDLASDKEIVITLVQGATISGVVDDPQSPQKVRAGVWAQREDGWRSTGRVMPDGTFTIRGVPPGRYTVNATAYESPGSSRSASAKGVQAGATGVRLRLP